MGKLQTFAIPVASSASRSRGATAASAAPQAVDKLTIATGKPLHIRWKTFYTGDLKNKMARRKNRPVVIAAYAKTTNQTARAPCVVAAVLQDTTYKDLLRPSAKGTGGATPACTTAAEADRLFELDVISKAGEDKNIDKLGEVLNESASQCRDDMLSVV